MRKSLEERVLERIRKSDGCWLWTGYITGTGYGRYSSLFARLKAAYERRGWSLI